MNNIYLPELQNIRIKNFSLYPNGLDFNHDFVNGVNLIMGGNGMGKTTFVNVIKYAIIGHYKEGFDYTRTYLGNKIEKRTHLPWNYFTKRMNDSIEIDSSASVTIKYQINGVSFEIKRCLKEIKILSVIVKDVEHEGISINQSDYDRLFYNYSRETKKAEKAELQQKLQNTLQFKFETLFERYANLQFDDLIFFVNKILFFGEDHKTILWSNDDYNDVQTELFNKYFNDRKLNSERQEANRQAKYYDTQARHRSEDIRVIKKVLDKVDNEQDTVSEGNQIREKIEGLKSDRDNISKRIESLQDDRKSIELDLKISNNKINELSIQVSDIEQNQKKLENQLLKSKWITLHKDYHSFSKNISTNELCPLCSQELEASFVKKKMDSNNCILCDQQITKVTPKADKTDDLPENKVFSIHSKINQHQKRVYELEKQLKKLDVEFRDQGQKLRAVNTDLRSLEFNSLKKQGDGNEPVDSHQAFYDEIEELEVKKDTFLKKSKKFKERSEEISNNIEGEILKNVLTFSSLFSSYAEKFLGVRCSLTFDEISGKKRFYPVIDGKIREHEEELSESQRFFVDHSFRMSILSFFYKTPSFYIVETPDSSLDISYEHNAADVFLKFLEKPYCLILTTNLNNSEFLNYLAKAANEVSVINLMEIGKKSPIQDKSDILETIYNKVQEQINEK